MHNTATTADRYNWGYVFLDCTVETLSETFNFARAWGGEPKATYINTKVLEPSRLIPTRFTIDGMNVAAADFNEYNTTDAEGNVISPASNVLTFTHKTGNNTFETILTADEASQFTVANKKTNSHKNLLFFIELQFHIHDLTLLFTLHLIHWQSLKTKHTCNEVEWKHLASVVKFSHAAIIVTTGKSDFLLHLGETFLQIQEVGICL